MRCTHTYTHIICRVRRCGLEQRIPISFCSPGRDIAVPPTCLRLAHSGDGLCLCSLSTYAAVDVGWTSTLNGAVNRQGTSNVK